MGNIVPTNHPVDFVLKFNKTNKINFKKIHDNIDCKTQ